MSPQKLPVSSRRFLQRSEAPPRLPSTCHHPNEGALATYSLSLSLCFSAAAVSALGAASPAPAPAGAAPTSSGAPAAPADASWPASPAAAAEKGTGKRSKLTPSAFPGPKQRLQAGDEDSA